MNDREGGRSASLTSRRKQLRQFVENRDYAGLLEWDKGQRNIENKLFGVLFDPDESIRWRTAEALGKLMAQRAETKLEAVREVIRRLFWQMNDESGGVIWMAPQAMAEVLVNVPRLIEEYGNMLMSHMRLAPFEQGVNWAAYKLAGLAPNLIEDWSGFLDGSIISKDAEIRAYACAAYLVAGVGLSEAHREHLSKDTAELRIYNPERGEMETMTVAEFLAQVEAKLG